MISSYAFYYPAEITYDFMMIYRKSPDPSK